MSELRADEGKSHPMPFTGSVDLTHWRERMRIDLWLAMGYVAVGGLVLLPVLGMLWLAVRAFPLLEGVPSALLVLLATFYGVDVVRALRRPVDRACDDGVLPRKQDAPGLYALIDSVRARVAGPDLHRVVLSNRLNASVSQRARFPWLGTTRHTMEIGLPLLSLLPARQAGAIIAHEFGHLMGRHGLLGRRIEDLRQCLIRLQESLSKPGASAAYHWRWPHRISRSGLRAFLQWYVPRLDARSLAVRRAGEYVADQAAARWEGPQAIIQALYSLEVAECYLRHEFWPGVWNQARHLPAPGGSPFSQLLMGKAMEGLAPDQAMEWAYHALRTPTREEDTHPSLHDRVTRLGAETGAVALPIPSGGDIQLLLSESFLRDAAAKMDAQWSKDAEPAWQRHHQDWQGTVAAHEALRLRATTQRLSVWDWLAMSEKSRCLEDPAWEEELRRAYALAPDNPEVLHAMGVAHHHSGRLEEAAQCLERAMELDRMETLRCSRVLTRLSLLRGDLRAAAQHRSRADEAARYQGNIDAEFGSVNADDELAPHGLSLRDLRQIEQDLRPMSHYAERIWIVKKTSRIDSGFSRHVFVVVAGRRGLRHALDRLLMRGSPQQEVCRRMAENLGVNLPALPLWYFCTSEDPLARRLTREGTPSLE